MFPVTLPERNDHISKMQMKPQVIFQPTVYRDWQAGIHTVVNAIRPTLGPIPRLVANERMGRRNEPPALLDNGGTIARRIIQLPDRNADMGAMFLRHIIWHVHEEVGDGTATTAVLFETLYDAGVQYITSGGNAMRFRHYLEAGANVVEQALAEQIQAVNDTKRLTELAESLQYDPQLAKHLGEIFGVIGRYGRLEIRPSYEREDRHEFLPGSYWDSGILHKSLYNQPLQQRAELKDVHLFISDWEIESPQALLPLFRLAQQENINSLVIIARKLSDSVVALLNKANNDPKAMNIFAAETPGSNVTTQAEALEDLAKLTGGDIFPEVIGQSIGQIQPTSLGQARRVWADKNYVGIVGGRCDGRTLRQHVAQLKGAHETTQDDDRRARLMGRLGQLVGGTAVLYVGGVTESEMKIREEMSKRTALALRGAVKTGVLSGGGAALLNCRTQLEAHYHQAQDVNERAAYRALLKMIEAPIRTLAFNAGQDPSEVLAQIKWSPAGDGFDVRTNEVVDCASVGIWDVGAVLQCAVNNAIKGAALALTTDVLVQRRQPEEVSEP